ncbi:A/G-specific DNA-adenine glycosylase [Arenibacter palladensis]|uniref:Adenine DNA glycosylase n=1 Tax=Arenibacter palladensis TaxID=237373 RepID=A0A1M4V8K0_9FLAO|nr:A/G-specific adenine glycosylase [Arenibacter palladensis]SHE65284.1 A/G-specific DNA-adenine glycosylase [Arenibacter palladensis]
MNFSRIILEWYELNKRLLPWRNTNEPYRIWLSEIMLQQTRVAQGIPYYMSFVEAFPTVQDLAAASEEQVLKLWQGLGYYSRARNLHATAKIITEKYNGKFPDTYKELLQLKGIGDYTASAIASICFGRAEAVVDGNVYRVLSRYYGIDLPINGSEGILYFKELAKEIMDAKNIRDYNQGIMEFGALQCTPKNPDCNSCPLQTSCVAFATNRIDVLPVKIKKNKVRNRYFNYMVLVDENKQTLLQQRQGNGIWQNLYEFPLLETEKYIGQREVADNLKELVALEEPSEIYLYNENKIVHKLSHQHLHTRFWIITFESNLENGIQIAELHKYPVPVLIADFIKTFKI